MKRARPLIFVVLLILTACTSLPPIEPLSPSPDDRTRCSRPFVKRDWQFVHSIAATLPGGKNTLITGITTVFPDRESVHAMILSLEGLVLFDGITQGDKIDIRRGISVFATTAFAEGLMRDVRLIFLKPADIPVEIGGSAGGTAVCRYRRTDGSVVDVTSHRNGNWELVQYDAGHHPRRRVNAWIDDSGQPADGEHPPSRIELTALDTFGYALDMRLIQSAGESVR
ncbi:hypothetical protein KKI24_30410 [bacterium]|nr:hypothetical protein [bacterium]